MHAHDNPGLLLVGAGLGLLALLSLLVALLCGLQAWESLLHGTSSLRWSLLGTGAAVVLGGCLWALRRLAPPAKSPEEGDHADR